MRIQRHVRGRGDDGVTLVVAMLVMGVTISLSLLVVRVAITTTEASGRDRQRTVAVNAAEAGVDAAYASLQSAGTVLPCSWPNSGTAAVNAAPDLATARATLTYFKADGTALGHCPPTTSDVGANKPVQALVDGYGTTNAIAGGDVRTRHMQALVNLRAVPGAPLDKAIYAQSNIDFENNSTIRGTSAANADIYTNEDFNCANNENFSGSVTALGNITVEGSCTIAGDAFAVGYVQNSGGANGSIGGRAMSSSGLITLPGNFAVNGTLLARTSITWPDCGPPGKCLADVEIAAPPVYTFPAFIKDDEATLNEWRAQGYEVFRDDSDCNGIDERVRDVYAVKPSNTLLLTDCAVAFKSTTVALSNDLAIFARGGITTQNAVNFKSSSGTRRTLFWIVPVSATSPQSMPCVAPLVKTQNQFNFEATVKMFIYSPCKIEVSNNSDFLGQIIGGSDVQVNNQFTMTYEQIIVPGFDATSSTVASSYKIDIVYKREMR